jgi:signal transduction histidine kinase
MSERVPFVAANWKMHKTRAEALAFVNELRAGLRGDLRAEVCIAPVYTCLSVVAEAVAGTRVIVAAQDVASQDQGAFTGEVSPQMLAKSLDFRVDSCAGPLHVEADEEKLRQILLNLLTNALKFTPAGGRIVVHCDSDDTTVRVRVTDTGRGISPTHLESVFEPFVQVDRHVTPVSEQGVGLGLAISRELARAMHGSLVAESEVGRGSTFTLSLPLAR